MDKSEVWYGMMICYVLHLLTIYRQKYTNRVPKRGRSGAWAGPRRSTVAEVQRHWALLGDFRWQHDSMNSIGCLGISGKHQSNIISPTFWWIMWNIYWFIILYTLSFSVNQWKKCKDKSYINQWKKCKDKSYIQQNRSKQQFIDSSHFKSVNSRHVAVATPATRSPSWAPAARPIFQIRRMNTQVMAMLGKNVETGDIYNQRLTLINDG